MKSINFKALGSFIALGFLSLFSNAQDCTLDVGGKNASTIVEIFQLNAAQKATMETLRGELQMTTKNIEDEIQKLFDEHPQSTEEELIILADKYKVLQQKIIKASRESDEKLLSTFNIKQHDRYLMLCREAFRKPINVIPTVFKDSIAKGN